jgi:hypothetical protein
LEAFARLCVVNFCGFPYRRTNPEHGHGRTPPQMMYSPCLLLRLNPSFLYPRILSCCECYARCSMNKRRPPLPTTWRIHNPEMGER